MDIKEHIEEYKRFKENAKGGHFNGPKNRTQFYYTY